MNKTEHTTTAEQLSQMLRAVIEAGRSTGLIAPTYLAMMQEAAAQIVKREARRQMQGIMADARARKAAARDTADAMREHYTEK